jgi:hypothetical protein
MGILERHGLDTSDIRSATLIVRVQGLPEEDVIQVPVIAGP